MALRLGISWPHCVISLSSGDHINHVRQILSHLRAAEATLKLRRCHFITGTIDCLGQVLWPRRLKAATLTKEAIKEFKSPTSITKLRSFLGLRNLLRRFVPSFIRKAATLNENLEKKQPTHFGALSSDERKATKELQDKLVSPEILALPYAEGR